MKVTKLKTANIRSVWKGEATDFTPWLAENIEQIGEEIGIGIDPETVETEKQIGGYRADIVAEDKGGNKIVIENQYETTDHRHLGEILTYAAGIGAKNLVWITENIREEHQKVVEYLNNATTDDLNFFLVKIETFQIGEDSSAFKFSIVERPNQWGRSMRGEVLEDSRDYSELKMIKKGFWQKVRDYGMKKYPAIKWRNPTSDHWMDLSVGSSKSHIAMLVYSQGHGAIRPEAGVSVNYQFWPKNYDKNLFDHLEKSREEIENELGFQLEWRRNDDKQYSEALVFREGNYRDPDEQDALAKWIVENAAKFYEIIPKYDKSVRSK